MNTRQEISTLGKVVAGLLLIAASVGALMILIGFWPDRMPQPGEKITRYHFEWFNVTLIDTTAANNDTAAAGSHPPTATAPQVSFIADSTKASDSTGADSASHAAVISPAPARHPAARTMHLNTILLVLVAATGFLGSMVHIASSFTNYIGANEFKRSWMLWYFVKPFTGAAVAVIFYFVFRAGFLNVGDNGGSINLYGIIALSALSGLFTDKATLKLEEIFTVIFKPKDDRPDKLTEDFTITEVTPPVLQQQGENIVTIKGRSLDKKRITIKMADDIIPDPSSGETTITFSYEIPPAKKSMKICKLSVADELGNELFSNDFIVKDAGQPVNEPASAG
ncbi:hypothetical protein KTO58_24910 [Chitinophaga pendula]|uniref:hypothetical protein n=1 Tax=Chitinophaga TaxID=79328 RepID=UPI000BAEBB3B|nr:MULTISPECIES: hypothetical protein [Chitinophaga]ASZ10177.1 hypothetical protein CK934_03860 [Chitinophaga sp. MD30]UCJ06868.1 hypothetical protein KTO58_24910 [Chitinophaga pendula]